MTSDFDPVVFTPNRRNDREHWYWLNQSHPILFFWQITVRVTNASYTFDPALGIIAGQISDSIERRLLWVL